MPEATKTCSFCARCQHDVAKLIAGPGVYICDACVLICIEILFDEAGCKPHGQEETTT